MKQHTGHRGVSSSDDCSAGPPLWPSFPQWLLSADSSKAVDVMSVVSFWVSEQRATLPH